MFATRKACRFIAAHKYFTSTSRHSYGIVEARRSATAGHGPVMTGRPVRGHGLSRPVTASHVAAGLVTAVTAPGRRSGPLPLATTGFSRPRNARLRDRSAIALCGTSRHVRLSRSPLPCLRSRRCPRDLAATLRSRLRSKTSQGQKGLLQGRSCHAAIGARIVPWRQPGDWAMNHPIAFTALLRPDPDWLASAHSPCGGGAGLGRDRLLADPMVRWRVLGRAQARRGRRRPEAGDSGQSREEPRNAGTRTAGDQGPAGQDAGRTGPKWQSGGARPRQGPGTRARGNYGL